MRVSKHPYSGHTGHARDFIKLVDDMARNRSHSDIFSDFLEMGYCAIAKRALPPGEQADALEARYMKAVRRDSSNPTEYGSNAARLLAHLSLGLKDERDFLGPIAAELGALNVGRGQFFTPWTVCELMAHMSLADCGPLIRERGFVTLQEPASGAGAMVLAASNTLRGLGFNPALNLFAEARDVSHTCYKMTYLQLALCNIPAHVICGDTLRGTMTEWAYTPAMFDFIEHHGTRWFNFLETSHKPEAPPKVAAPTIKPRAFPTTSPLARLRRHSLQGTSPTPQITHRQAAIEPRRLAVGKRPPSAFDAALLSKREDTR
jgi:hypothetical protein